MTPPRQDARALLNARSRKTLGRDILLDTTAARNDNGNGFPHGGPVAIAPVPRLITRPLSEFAARSVTWLWRNWLPAGKLTIIDGYPGDGKSHIAAWLVAALSAGRPMLDGSPTTPCDVLWLSYEEDPHDTIRPRLEAADADLTRIHLIEGIDRGDDPPGEVSTEHAVLIEAKINELRARGSTVQVLVIDPLSLVLPAKTDTNNDAGSRQALQPLARLAQRHGVAVLVVRHFNKSQGQKALLKGGGSIGFAAAARAVWTVTDHPDDPERKVLAVAKLSNGKKPSARAFQIVGASLPPTLDVPHGIETSRLEWGDELAQSADDLLAATYEDPEHREERQQCGEWLVEFLQSQPERTAKSDDVVRAARAAGFGDRAVRKAAGRAGVIKERVGFGGGSVYRYPPAVHSGTRPHSGPIMVPERGEVPERESTAERTNVQLTI